MKIPQIRCSDVNAVKRIIFLLVLLIPFCLAGCSSDDDEGDNGGEGPNEDAPVSYVLGSGNTNMPSSGTIIAQYADAPVGSEIRRLVDDNADTKYVTYHSSFNITWNGNSSKAVTAYSLTSAADTPEMDRKIGHSMVLMIILRGQNWMRRQTNFLQREKKRKAMKWIMQLPIVTTDFLLKRTMVVLPRR